MEWQANRFAISLFLPKEVFFNYLCAYRKLIGIRSYFKIYLDNQPINQMDFRNTVDYLSETFNISKTAVKYRMEELNIITHAEPGLSLRSLRQKLYIID